LKTIKSKHRKLQLYDKNIGWSERFATNSNQKQIKSKTTEKGQHWQNAANINHLAQQHHYHDRL